MHASVHHNNRLQIHLQKLLLGRPHRQRHCGNRTRIGTTAILRTAANFNGKSGKPLFVGRGFHRIPSQRCVVRGSVPACTCIYERALKQSQGALLCPNCGKILHKRAWKWPKTVGVAQMVKILPPFLCLTHAYLRVLCSPMSTLCHSHHSAQLSEWAVYVYLHVCVCASAGVYMRTCLCSFCGPFVA